MNHDPNSVPAHMVQGLTQSHADFASVANHLYDAQLDLARDAQHQLRDAKERIQRMEHALIIADERLRKIDEGRMTMANQVILDRALDTIRPTCPPKSPSKEPTMTRPTPASMPAVDRTVARAGRLQNLDDLIAETHYVFDAFVDRGFNADDALTLTEITLTRKA